MRHTYRCSMRWSDMDAYGHVNNVVFLTYLEEARVDHLFTLGAEVGAKALSDGIVVARQEIDYKAPLVYHPRGVDVTLWIGRIGGASFRVEYEVHDGSTVFARAATVVVAYDRAEQRPRRLTDGERTFLERYLEPAGAR